MAKVLDYLCNDEWCQKRGTYILPATCRNCGTKVLVRFTRGHESSIFGPECPYCGNHRWMYGSVEGLGNGAEPRHEDVGVNAGVTTDADS